MSLLLQGCLKSDLVADIPASPSSLVVEGYVTPGYPAEIMLTESNTLQDDLVLLAVWNAKVSIGTDTGAMTAQNILYRKTDRRIMVNYGCADTVRVGAHSFFNLSVTTKDGRTVQASTKIVGPVHIKKVELHDEQIIAQHDLLVSAPRYVRLHVATYKQGKVVVSKSMMYEHREASNTSCTMPLSNYKTGADSVVVSLFHIQKEYYDYLTSVDNANSAFSDPLLNPEGIRSNVQGGIGIFTYYTVDRSTIKLR